MLLFLKHFKRILFAQFGQNFFVNNAQAKAIAHIFSCAVHVFEHGGSL